MDIDFYEIIDFGTTPLIRCSLFDGSFLFIPIDEANSDYQTYLAWLQDQA